MRAPVHSIVTAALALALAAGCSRGILPLDTQQDGGISNHLGEDPVSLGGVQQDAGPTLIPGGGGGGSDAGAAGGGGGGLCGTGASTGDAALDACLGASCCATFTPCMADAACQACLANPAATGCSSNSTFLAFDSCWASSCDTATGGGGGGGGTSGGVCGSGESTGDTTVDACLDSACCTSFNACYTNATCQACMYDSTTAGCSSNSTYLAFDDCWTSSCDASTGGGGGGSGVCGSDLSTGDSYYDACIDAFCCAEFSDCASSTTCTSCLGDPSAAGCSSNSRYVAFDDCVYYSC